MIWEDKEGIKKGGQPLSSLFYLKLLSTSFVLSLANQDQDQIKTILSYRLRPDNNKTKGE